MKTKFIYVFLTALLLSGQVTLSAQNRNNKENREKKERPTPEQIMQRQTDQMTKALMLDDALAAKFTPVYERYLKDLRECRMMNHKPRGQKANAQETGESAAEAPKPAMTDAEIAKHIKGQFAQSRKMLDIREKYYADFSKILSQKQIMKIYQMEKNNVDKFKKEFDRRKGQKHGDKKRQGQRTQAPRQE